MNNLQYLTEKDFEYFRNKQKDGDPVRIIYLDPETLDKISFDDIDRMEKEARDKNGEQPSHGCEKGGGKIEGRKTGCSES